MQAYYAADNSMHPEVVGLCGYVLVKAETEARRAERIALAWEIRAESAKIHALMADILTHVKET